MTQTNTILIVDDNDRNLVSFQAVLEAPDARLLTATSGQRALQILLDEPEIDLILLDVQMPGMDGFETAQLIQQHQRFQHIPILFVTAIHRTKDYIHQGFRLGASDYITKPVDSYILQSKVNIFLTLVNQRKSLTHINAALEISRASMQSLVDKNQVGMMVVNQQGVVEFANPAIQALFSQHGELIGQPFGIPITAGERLDVTIVRGDNEYGTAEMNIAETIWNNHPAYLVMLYDITARKQAETKLQAELEALRAGKL